MGLYAGIIFLGLLAAASGLSCYVCDHDDWNWGTCTTNFIQCAPFQDSCTSYTSYMLPPKYNARGERYHRISKGCDTQQGCLRRQQALAESTCFRTAYADWSCVECCTGDLCNYYITLGSSAVRNNLILISVAAVLVHFCLLRH
jgi:lymphocyte antigen 6 complex protein